MREKGGEKSRKDKRDITKERLKEVETESYNGGL
jgi:hypothetical protein